jgi:hypothetical protein
MDTISDLDFVPPAEEITTSMASGTTERITLHDGTYLQINKLEMDWDSYQTGFSSMTQNAQIKNCKRDFDRIAIL